MSGFVLDESNGEKPSGKMFQTTAIDQCLESTRPQPVERLPILSKICIAVREVRATLFQERRGVQKREPEQTRDLVARKCLRAISVQRDRFQCPA